MQMTPSFQPVYKARVHHYHPDQTLMALGTLPTESLQTSGVPLLHLVSAAHSTSSPVTMITLGTFTPKLSSANPRLPMP